MNASLSDHFFAKFGRGSVECKAAQRAFAESMAAYSLVCYFLQIKVGPSYAAAVYRGLRAFHTASARSSETASPPTDPLFASLTFRPSFSYPSRIHYPYKQLVCVICL